MVLVANIAPWAPWAYDRPLVYVVNPFYESPIGWAAENFLFVEYDEIVRIDIEEDDWIWCLSEKGKQGWLPIGCVYTLAYHEERDVQS